MTTALHCAVYVEGAVEADVDDPAPFVAAPPERTGIYFNEGAWKSFPIPVRLKTFPEHFAEHGYRTATLVSHAAQA